MTETATQQHQQLRLQLAQLTTSRVVPSSRITSTVAVDVVITPNEVNSKHGTGVLVKRMFGNLPNVFSIRSFNHYGGEHEFGESSTILRHVGFERVEIFQNVLNALAQRTTRRVVCIPYFPDELHSAIALKELYAAKLCGYIMDDQNICSNGIPDSLMREFLLRCDLRLAISPELRSAYEQKYGLKFWLLPPPVPSCFIQSSAHGVADEETNPEGIIVGNVWGAQWLRRLRETIKNSGSKLHWYCDRAVAGSDLSSEELAKEGIVAHRSIPEAELVSLLKRHKFTVIPSGTLESGDECKAIAQLSLPSRATFILAASGTPIVVLGNRKTAVAQFVERFHIGAVADYNADSYLKAVQEVSSPAAQAELRNNAAAVAKAFSDDQIGEWIWRSLEAGEPCDLRFEDLFPRFETELVPFIEPPVPSDVYRDFVPVYHVLRRLKRRGWSPDFVLDVGASVGVWSYAVSKLFRDARFIMIDPLMSRYDASAREFFLKAIPNVEPLEAAISNRSGRTSFQVPPDLYGASLLRPADFRSYERVEVETKTVDQVVKEKRIVGRGLLKADVQCAEHLVLEGAKKVLPQVDVICLELSMVRYHQDAKVFLEMLNLLDSLGFRYYDDAGYWRSPTDGTLLQKDVFFVRKELFVPETSN